MIRQLRGSSIRPFIYRLRHKLVPRLALGLALALLFSCGGNAQDKLRLGEEHALSDEAEITATMIESIKAISLQRHSQGPVKRFNQVKSLGCFDASFTVSDGLPENLRQGIFSTQQTFPAKIRFANATKFDDTEKDFRGMSIKLSQVTDSQLSAKTLWGEPGQQDFLLNSHPALFAADPGDFLDFIQATKDKQVWRYFINPTHFYSLKVVLQGRNKIQSPFQIRYWSTTPYRFGESQSQAVKYSVQPCSAVEPGAGLESKVEKHPHFLTEAMTEHMSKAPVCFDFMVQFQKDPVGMPIENAAIIWDEEKSPFLKVATITFKDQPFTSPQNQADCEAMSFNPWQSFAAHQPLGGINRIRKPVYSEIAKFRDEQNVIRNAGQAE